MLRYLQIDLVTGKLMVMQILCVCSFFKDVTAAFQSGIVPEQVKYIISTTWTCTSVFF